MTPRRQAIAQALFPELARIGKALSSPQRLQIVEVLCQGPRSVEVLANATGMTVANCSQHLQLLRAAHLVETEKDAQRVIYRVAGDDVVAFYSALKGVAHNRLAEVDRVMKELVRPIPIDHDSILERIKRGRVTLLDVRPSEEYEAGHLPGALHIPVEELEARIDEVPRDRDVVTYCRGPYCIMADEAVEILAQHGVRATALDLGIVELTQKKVPIARGADVKRALAVVKAPPASSPASRTKRPARKKAATARRKA